jgi:hypothetical protein
MPLASGTSLPGVSLGPTGAWQRRVGHDGNCHGGAVGAIGATGRSSESPLSQIIPMGLENDLKPGADKENGRAGAEQRKRRDDPFRCMHGRGTYHFRLESS